MWYIGQRTLFISFLTIITSTACIDRIDLELDSGATRLAINGHITNRIEPYLITIVQQGSYGKVIKQQRPISNAEVIVESASGGRTNLQETSPGNYLSDSTKFTGVVGEHYRLRVFLSDGRSYLSAFEPLLPVPPITNLDYFFYEEQYLNESEIISSQKRIDVLVSTPVPLNGNNVFFSWEVRGEYEFRELEALTDIFAYTGVGPTMFTCFVQDNIRLGEIVVHDASTSRGAFLNRLPIKTVDVDYKFAFNYCVHVDQLSLSEPAYRYWQAASQTLDRNGTILEEAIGKLRGNITSVNNAEEKVHGYFYASAISMARLFVPRDSVDRPVSSCIIPDPAFEEVCKECVEIEQSTRKRPAYWPN